MILPAPDLTCVEETYRASAVACIAEIVQVILQDVRSYESVMNGICDKAKSLLQSSIDPKSSGFISNSRTRYRKLCGNAEVCIYITRAEQVNTYVVSIFDIGSTSLTFPYLY